MKKWQKNLLLLTLLLACLPMFRPDYLLGLHESKMLSGIDSAYEQPPLTLQSLWHGNWQAQWSSWFDHTFTFRNYFIRTENTLNLLCLREISSKSQIPIILGKQSQLFEKNNINVLNGVSELKGDLPLPSPLPLEESVRRLGRAYVNLRKAGIGFVFILHPHKTWIYPELLPDKWKLKDQEKAHADFAKLSALLLQYRIPFVSGPDLFANWKRTQPNLILYNSGGAHWTNLAACMVLKEALAKIADDQPRILPIVECEEGPLRLAEEQDVDLLSITNTWNMNHFSFLPFVKKEDFAFQQLLPEAKLLVRGKPHSIGYLSIGTSFSRHLVRLLDRSGTFNKLFSIGYYRSRKNIEDRISLLLEPLRQAKFVILEQSQGASLSVNVSDFVDDLEATLEKINAKTSK